MEKFNRREFLGLSTAGLALAGCGKGLEEIAKAPNNSQSYRFKLGKFECTVVNEGAYVGSTADFLFFKAPKDLLEERLKAYNLNPDKITLPINCLVVNTGDYLVLIDTGYGTSAKQNPTVRKAGKLLENLDALGIEPEDFDTVIITHSHGDHIGGCSNEEGEPTFPNAKYFISKPEWEFAIAKTGTRRDRLIAIQDQIELLERDTEILPGIETIAAPGHNPGHIIVKIYSDFEEILHVSDLLGHPIHVEFPDWSMGEYNPDQAAKTRYKILERALKDDLLLHSPHLNFPGLGYIISGEKGWKWQPISNK